MSKIERAVILGGGAVGSVLASRLFEAQPRSVAVLADGERAKRYRREGFVVNGNRLGLTVLSPEDAAPEDLIIVAVKNHHLAEAVEAMRGFVGPGTTVLSLLNGITSERVIGAAIGEDYLLYGMILGIDAVRVGNRTEFSTSGRIFFGEERNPVGAWSARVAAVAAFFDRAGVAHVVPEDMLKSLWFKFMINVGINQASAILRAPYGVFLRIDEARRVMEAAMREVIAVSKPAGVPLSEEDLTAWYKTLEGLDPSGKTSMLQDVEAGRKTEVEIFAGTVVDLGRAHGIPTPINEVLLDLIRTIEKTYTYQQGN